MPILGRVPHAIIPMGRVDYVDQSTIPLIYWLLRNPNQRRYYVLKVEPYDKEAETTLARYYSSGLIGITGFDGLWQSRLVEAFNVATDLFTGELGFGGSGKPSYGTITIAVGDNIERNYVLRDDFAWLDWHRRDLTLFLGGHPEDGWTWGDYVQIFKGTSDEATWTEDLLTLIVRDPTVKLDEPIQGTLYTGEGGDEGDENLEGQPKPLAFGILRNITPVLVDRLNLVYQVHDGPIISVDAVYDKGEAYQNDGDLPGAIADVRDYTWLETETGRYITDLSKGLIRLSTTPNGVLTMDIHGDNDSGTLHKYQGAVAYRILTDFAGWSNDDLVHGSFARLDRAQREVSVYLTGPTNLGQMVDAILAPHGYRTYDTTGRLVIGHIEFRTPVLTLAPPKIVSITRDRTPPPVWRISFGYAKNWTVVREADLTIPDNRDIEVDFATNEFRRKVVEDETILVRNPSAKDAESNSLFSGEEAALAEVQEMFELYKIDRDIYRVAAVHIQFRVHAGNTIKLVHPRFGLFDGKNFIVLSVSENTNSGLTELTLWG